MTISNFPIERTAVISGAGAPRGIGRKVAYRLAESGWSLALVDINSEAVQEFAKELSQKKEVAAIGIGIDIANKKSVEEGFKVIDEKLPPVIAEVNLAGIASPHTIFELTDDIFTKVMDVNAKGTLFMMQVAAERMIKNGYGGRIVNTASITAYDGGGTFSKTGYAAAKAAVQGLTRGGARELGQYGITCNAIVPGPIDTEIMGGVLTDERKAQMSSNIPLQRVGQPEEVAGLINFLVGEESSFINGDSIFIDGGKHMV